MKLMEAIEQTLRNECDKIKTENHSEKYVYFNRNDIKLSIVISDDGIKYNNKFERWNKDIFSNVSKYIYLNIQPVST